MTLGDKTRKTPQIIDEEPDLSNLEQTVSINIHATGSGVSKIDWIDWFLKANDGETTFVVTHAEIKLYYSEKKDK